MGIPERFYRIARHKLNELRDRFDQMDAEAQEAPEVVEKRRRAESRADSKRELEDAMTNPSPPSKPPAAKNEGAPSYSPPLTRRTPEEIRRGTLSPSSSGSGGSGTMQSTSSDPLEFHYRRLGVESGSDFATVQAAYHKLIARADPGRFPAGSEDAQLAEQIRQEIEASYKALRDELDTTARRFDLLEFDTPPPAPKAESNPQT